MPTNAQIAGGHKATIHNPNTSQEAKEHSRRVLEDDFNYNVGNVSHGGSNANKNPTNVAGGLKAALHNSHVSDEAKENVKQRLGGEY